MLVLAWYYVGTMLVLAWISIGIFIGIIILHIC
jgi:hypothetical protein